MGLYAYRRVIANERVCFSTVASSPVAQSGKNYKKTAKTF